MTLTPAEEARMLADEQLGTVVRHRRFAGMVPTGTPFDEPQTIRITLRAADLHDAGDVSCAGPVDEAVACAFAALQQLELAEQEALAAAPPLSAHTRKADPLAVTQPMHGIHCGIRGGGTCTCGGVR